VFDIPEESELEDCPDGNANVGVAVAFGVAVGLSVGNGEADGDGLGDCAGWLAFWLSVLSGSVLLTTLPQPEIKAIHNNNDINFFMD
jgi:hypothetical protein